MLVIIVIIILAYSSCNQLIYLDFLAVSGDRGKLIPSSILIQGQGNDLFLKINYTTDVDTQTSFIDAYKLSDINCNVYINIDSDVSGGSGGLLFYIALKYRTNLTGATGGIDSQGNILPIGGLYEKLEAGAKRYKNFVVPVGSIYQYYVTLTSKYNITYANHISDLKYSEGYVYGLDKPNNIFFYPKVPKINSKYNSSILIPIYNKMKDFYNNIGSIHPEIDSYYNNLLNVIDSIAEKEYYYTAANYLYLASSERNAIYYLSKNIDPQQLKTEAEKCLNEFNIEGNSENDIAALTRYEWAKSVLRKIYGNKHEDKYKMYYDYTQAYLWCQLAKSIYQNILINYSNETRELAISWLIKSLDQSLDNLSELDVSRYKIAISKIATDPILAAYNLAFIVKNENALKDKYSSIWANIYASHAQYNSEIGDIRSGVELANIANNMEYLFGENNKIISKISKFNNEFNLMKIALGITAIIIILWIATKIMNIVLKLLLLVLLILIILIVI